MTLHTRQSGAWAKVGGLYIRQSGVWTPVKNAYVRDGGVWKVYYSSEIVVEVTTNQSGMILQYLFSASDWASDTPKRVVINSGVVISGTSWGALATKDGSLTNNEWGGTLTLDNYGIIQGMGGGANSGVGRSALFEDTVAWTKSCIVNNFGTIRAGGGGGGQGGQGGQGYWVQEFLEGPRYGSNAVGRWVVEYAFDRSVAWWDGYRTLALVGSGHTEGDGNDGWRYYRGNFQEQPNGLLAYYAVLRRRWEDRYQAGAAGGVGGRGQGSDGVNTGGSVGGNNGGNSGTGGTGGTGGAWGENGSGGANGNAGNSGAGSAGTGGGLAGIAYTAAKWTMTNTGTIQGRIL